MVAQPSDFASARASGEEPAPLDERAAFLQALSETMQATMTAERARVADDIERRRAAHLAEVHARRETVASRIRELADDDRRAIDRWASDERIRIQFERDRRAQELERDLATSLAEHDTRIDQDIQRVEAAIAAHRAEVEAYFTAVSRETDPVAIAQRAGERPRFPNIETNPHAIVSAPPRSSEPAAPAVEAPVVAAAADVPEPAAAAAVEAPVVAATTEIAEKAEAPLVPVMVDPIAAKRAEWWAAWKALHEPPELSEVLASAEEEAARAEQPAHAEQPAAVAAGSYVGPDEPVSALRLESIPILRPFARLRRDRDPNAGTNGEK